MTDATELVDLVARRHGIIHALQRRPRARHHLVDDLNDAKSTVYKGVTQLVDAGLVKQTAEGLSPTLLGEVALRRYEELARTAELETALASLPADAIDPVVFVGSEFIAPDAGAVDRHLEYVNHLLETARDVRGVVPAAASENVDVVRDRVARGELTVEFVLSEALADTIQSEQTEAVTTLADDGATLWRTERDIPFGVFVARGDDTTEMGVEFRDGYLVIGLALNDTTESIAWAEAFVDRYTADAERMPIES